MNCEDCQYLRTIESPLGKFYMCENLGSGESVIGCNHNERYTEREKVSKEKYQELLLARLKGENNE